MEICVFVCADHIIVTTTEHWKGERRVYGNVDHIIHLRPPGRQSLTGQVKAPHSK